MNEHSLLISDLHLGEQQADLNQLFERFLQQTAPNADALYILGDLFEYWLGDDTLDQTWHARVCDTLHNLSMSGVKLYFAHGNRDFLLGTAFAARCGGTLLADYTLHNLHGIPSLLMHGDTLCTDDVDYQKFRQQVRQVDWQQHFLSQPLSTRLALAHKARESSAVAKQDKTPEIMDINLHAMEAVYRQYNFPILIHGHTHRSACHHYTIDGHEVKRWVLPDWHDQQGGYLRCDAGGGKLVSMHL